jgi:outer membrane biosynthesis protein TonB
MSTEDVVVVATVREEIRSQRPFVNTAEIERRIEAAQVKVVAYVDDDDDDDDSESEGDAEPYTNSKGGGEGAAYPYPVAIGRHPPVSGQPMGKSNMVKPVSPTTSRPPTPIPVPLATSRPPSPQPSTPTMSRPAAPVAANAANAPIAPNMGQGAATSALGQDSEKKDARTRRISNQRVPTSGRGLSVASTNGNRGLWSGMNGVNGGSG